MISVALVVPTWHYFLDPFKLQPLNELYLATVIDSHFQNRGITANVIDLRDFRITKQGVSSLEYYISTFPAHDFYFYWIAKSADYFEILSIVKSLRKVHPQSKHAAGGTHVINFPDECAVQFDAITTGPGEESFITMIKDFKKNKLRNIYKSDWKKVHYDNYPFARRDYLPEKAIVNKVLFEKYGKITGTSAMFSRGCCFKCAYCVYNIPNAIQMRSPKSIAIEIAYLKKAYRIGGINLRDEICIPLSRKTALANIAAFGRANMLWRGQTRIGADKEILKLAHDAGCVELALGVESVSQKVLDIINKKQNIKEIRDTIRNCRSIGIKIKMCLILGLPGEPANIVSITKKFIEQTQPDYVNISGFCPAPGSVIFTNPEYYGIKRIDEDWSKHAHLLFRFSDQEHFGLPFEYATENRWGKTFSKREIINNIQELQHYLQEREMSY